MDFIYFMKVMWRLMLIALIGILILGIGGCVYVSIKQFSEDYDNPDNSYEVRKIRAKYKAIGEELSKCGITKVNLTLEENKHICHRNLTSSAMAGAMIGTSLVR